MCGGDKAVLDVHYLGKVAAVKMGVVPGHGHGSVAGNFLNFQRIYICH